MTERSVRRTPPGTWPLLVSGAQLLLLVPAYFLGLVVPSWLAIGGAFLFVAVAFGALAWSFATYLRHPKPGERGVPLAGIPLGVIATVVSALVLLPAAFGSGPDAGTDAAADVDTDVAEPFALDADFPDPDVLEVDGLFYAYATQDGERNVQVATSPDLREWTPLEADALPDLPDWAVWGDTWAPEVARVGDGFALYFTTTNAEPRAQCIGVALADRPEGPFEPVGDAALVCPLEEGGAIDASTFLDSTGILHLLWKNDGNCCGLDTWISIAPLDAAGVALAGEPTRLIQQDQGWEGSLVEAPTLIEHEGRFVLFYSANDYYGLDYAIGYAVADELLGPYTKAPEPLLSTESSDFAFYGPGGQDVVGDSIVFHSWNADHTHRGLNVASLDWVDGVPVVALPRPVD